MAKTESDDFHQVTAVQYWTLDLNITHAGTTSLVEHYNWWIHM